MILVFLVGIISFWIQQYSSYFSQNISTVLTGSVDEIVHNTWSIFIDTGAIVSSEWFSSGIVESDSTGTIRVDSGVTISSSDCLFDICIDPKKPVIKQADGTRVQANDPEFDGNGSVVKINYATKFDPNKIYSEIVKINIAKGFASKAGNDVFSNEETITRYGNFFLRIDAVGGCAGLSKKQTILDLNGKESDISHFVTTYPKNFSIWNIQYTFSGVAGNYENITIYTPEQVLYTGSISVHDDIGNILHDFAIQNKFLAKNYIVEFREIPGVKMLYTSSLIVSDRLVSLGIDSAWIKKNIIKDELLDLDVTKKILGYYNNTWRGITMKNSDNGYEDMITDSGVLSEQLPIFRIIPIDTSGNYLLYTTSNYEISQFAELCKPLVYVYSNNPENNILSVMLPSGGYFSKLIPHFSYGNSWKFHSEESGNIEIEDKDYWYLYYSAKVPNYQWNTDGWQVYGSDIVAFFENKLPKTGMNTREMSDFIGFWKWEFKPNQRYFVSFKFDASIDTYAKLSFQKEPDTLHRILLEAYPIEQPIHNNFYLWPQIGNRFDANLLRSFARSGKRDVLEWGWVVFDHDKNTYIIR